MVEAFVLIQTEVGRAEVVAKQLAGLNGVLSSEYVTTARVKGLSEWNVIWRHAFRNIRIQLITVIALSYANLLEGSVLTEIIFAWPGIGSYITVSLLANDMNAVLGGTVVIGVIFVGLNIFSDLLYRFFDPRSK